MESNRPIGYSRLEITVSEVMRWKLKGFIPGVDGMSKALFQPTVVLAEDYDAAQSELAALREELASRKAWPEWAEIQVLKNGVAERDMDIEQLQQRLTSAERRNAGLLLTLRSALQGVERQEQPTTDDTFIRGWKVSTEYFGLRMEAVEWIRTGQAAAHDTDTELHPLYFANHPASPPADVAQENIELKNALLGIIATLQRPPTNRGYHVVDLTEARRLLGFYVPNKKEQQ